MKHLLKRLSRAILLCTLAAWPLASAQSAPGEHFPQTRTRVLSQREIANLNYVQRRYAINEMYARHGYKFGTLALRRQFQRFSWYHPVAGRTQSGAQARFNANERRNLARLQAARDADASDDTGDVGDSGYVPGPNAETSDYLPGEHFPQTRQEYLSEDDLAGMNAAQVRYAINEMYARHGYEFPQKAAIRAQFSQFDWYWPVRGRTQAQAQARFNAMERANLQKLIGVRDMAG